MAILKDLIVHGSSRFLNKIYASEIQTPLIDAEAGVFKKLKADDATIVGLLDVQGQMHTNSWTNSNIATIDGSFYITPTLSSSSGTVSFSSATAATFTGTYSAVSSLYVGNNTASTVQWTSGSKILITGEVQIDGEWTPLGTLLGTLNSTNPTTSMPIVSITDNRNNPSAILADIYSLKSNTSLTYRNLKVSLYQRADNSEYYPLGIFMTALGQNGKTFLDIYGGVNTLTTSYGGYADPNVRIGNLSGLPAITTAAGNFSPVGWGIYTTNGYFSGTIVSSTGVIGGWRLGASSLYNGTTGLNNTTAGIYLGIDGIRNYKDNNTYVNITEGVITAKGVNLTGEITATRGTIGGCTISNGVLTVGNANINDINASKINAGDIEAARIQTNLISAINAKVSDLSALTATIGGFQIDSSSIHTNNVAITSNADNSIALSSADFTRTINNTSREGLRFAIGDKFGVTGDGTIYASNVDLTGKITATSGTIGGASISDGVLYITNANISGTINGNHIDASSISIGNLNGVSDYAQKTYVDDAIDDISIGGRNLALLTSEQRSSREDDPQYIISYVISDYGQSLMKDTDTYFTVSFDYKITGDYSSASDSSRIYAMIKGSGIVGGGSYNALFVKDAPSEGHYTATAKLSADQVSSTSWLIRTRWNGIVSGCTYSIKNLKFEIGNVETSWTPAPEDTQENINNVSTTANTALNQSVEYIKGTQTAATASWTGVTTESSLRDGKIIMYYLPYKGASNVTLTLTLADNTTTDAIPVYLNYSTSSNDSALTRVSTHYPAGSVIQMTYDGVANQWKTTGYNTNVNTNTVGVYGAASVIAGTNASDASATTVYKYTLIMKKVSGTNPRWVSIVTSSSTGTSKTRYTGGLYLDEILYMGSNANYATGKTTGTSYTALGINLSYSTNCGSTLTIGRPVYLVGTIDSLDGLFYLDSTWWTQTEPITEDGKIYIYLGLAYSTTNIYLVEKKTIMRYYRGAFRTEEQIAGMTATSYITYIDAANGIKVHNYNNVTDYIQINSDAISMYRRDTQQPQVPIETLRIQSDNIRIGKIGTGKRNVLITDNNIQIRNNTTVLASYGDEITFYRPDTSNSVLSINSSNIRIGQENYQNLLLKSNEILLKTGNKQSLKISPKELSYFFKNGNSPFYIKQLEKPQTATGDGSKKQFVSNTSYFIQQLYGISINGIEQKENEDYTYSISNGICTVDFVSAPANNATIIFDYDIEYEIAQLLKTASDADPSARKYIGLPQTCMEVLHVYVNNIETSAWHYPSFSVQGETITIHDYIQLNSDPGQGASIKVLYKKQAGTGFYMTMGIRQTGENGPGAYSLTVGKECVAEGQSSFAGGKNTAALGKYSFAYGDGGNSDSDCVEVNADCAGAIGKGLRINRTGGFACGTYNTYSPNYTWAFQVGNGTSAMDRSDAFGVASNGNIYTTGILMSGVVGKSPKALFTTQVFSVDNIVVPATGGSTAATSDLQQINIGVTGYVAIGLMSFLSQTATNNGANASCVFPYVWWINQGYFRFRLRNTVASQVKTKITFRILYISASAVYSNYFPSNGEA